MEIFLLVLLVIVLFLLPSTIAFLRRHRNRWMIFLINVVFGATVLGWLFALIWSMNKLDDPLKGGTKYGRDPHDPNF